VKKPTVTQWIGLAAGIVAFALLLVLDTPLKHVDPKLGSRPAFAAAVASLMAIWWLTEALPIYVTALVPFVLYPIVGVFGKGWWGDLKETGVQYVDSFIFLFAGGMCIAAAMQQCDLHRRIALVIMRGIGTDPRRLLFGMLCATAFVSLWISNTATAAMMLPIGLAILAQLEARVGARLVHYGAAMMLSVAYAANIGGIGTKIGTAPNSQFAGFMAQQQIDVTFLKFMAVGLPFVIMLLPVAWWLLWRVGRHDAPSGDVGRSVVESEIEKLGAMKRVEKIVLAVFVATAVLWIGGKWITEKLAPVFKAQLDYKLTGPNVEGATAMLAAFLLLAMRINRRQVLEGATLKKVPWETLLLLGGGFAMGAGIDKSGLAAWMGLQMQVVQGLPLFWQTLLACLITVGLTAVASNTATIGVMLQVLKSSGTTVLFAATIASSCDFALPAGTPPNAIVFGSGYLTVARMAKTGVVLDIIAALLAAAWCWAIVRFVL